MVQQQIAEREQQRLLDEEKRDQEQQQMLRYLERLQKEDMDAMEQKREDQRMLMAEVGKANEVRYWLRQNHFAGKDDEETTR